MLKHEFEVLLGRTVTDKSYVEANTMYMNAGEMTKEDFCREWLKIGHTSLAHVDILNKLTPYGLFKLTPIDNL